MSKKKVPLYRHIAGGISIALINFTGIIPLPASRALMAGIAKIAYYTIPRIQKIGMENLNLAYGDSLTEAEKKRILKESVYNIAMVAAEFSRSHKITKNLEQYVQLKGVENLDFDRGGVLIAGHYSNWEWMVAGAASVNNKIIAVIRELDAPNLNAKVDYIRRTAGIDTIPKDDAGMTLFMRMTENWIAGIAVDQCPSNSAVPTTFFGQPCWSTIGPAMLAIKAQVPVYPAKLQRQKNGMYIMTFLKPIEMEVSGNTRLDIQHNTQRIQDLYEEIIREDPGQWLWLHKRWKKRPRMQQEWDERVKADKEKAGQI